MREISYRDALREALREEMQRDPTVFLLGEDIGRYWGGAFKVTKGLAEEFGDERVRDTPISESAIVGAAVGAAITGMRPVAEIMFGDLTTLAMDQIVNQAAKIRYMFGGQAKVPLVIRTPFGGGVNIAAHHSQCLEALFMHVPGLQVAVPSTPYDAKGLIKSAIREDNPVLFIEYKRLYGETGPVPEEPYYIPLGEADVKRRGSDATIVVTSAMGSRALEAAEKLSEKGIECEIIDPRTLVPLNLDCILESVRKTNRALIVHDAVRRCGIGAEWAALIQEHAFDYLDAPVMRLGGPETPVPYAPNLEEAFMVSVEDIVKTVLELTYRSA